ncbi:MAG: prephenate dehydrogenase/arogenate dehydrogenase family protein [Clostridiaceae bacterium]|mgnify:CR=1 FL=1|nr:prephenate dehydrogenase/arogenate dehydrogenase family protein [Clostridiaceae bacterium]
MSCDIHAVPNNGISRIGIVGLGLIGGSLAKAFRHKAGIAYISAVDKDREALETALKEGIIDEFDTDILNPVCLDRCDLVLLCTPLSVMKDMAPVLEKREIGVISDVGSVKEPVMDLIKLNNFIGGHPMAGSERQGYACANGTLFENAMYVLCVPDHCDVPASLLRDFEMLIRQIGAVPVHMTAKDHDQRVAAISHLPHVAASALSLLAARLDDGPLSNLAAGGFRDITRIASSDPSLWADITSSSAKRLIPILEKYAEIISEVCKDLKNRDEKAIESFFSQAAHYRNHLPVGGRGALDATTSLTVYLEDRPGELGAITTLLGKENINIRNINIKNFRTYEGGQLQLILGDSAQAVRACSLLKEAGYECD